MSDSSFIRVVDSEGTVKSYIFWSNDDSTLQIQNACDKIQSLSDNGSSEDAIASALSEESSAYLCLNPSGGRVGIGTKSPRYAFDVEGDIGLTGTFHSTKFGITSTIDTSTTPNTEVDTVIKIEKYKDTDSVTPIKSWSIGLDSTDFSIKNTITGIKALSFTDTITFGLPIDSLSVNNLTVNTKISYKSIISNDTFSITNGSIENLTSSLGSIDTLSVNQLILKGSELSASKFDSLLTTNTEECLDSDELYPLNTGCLSSSLGSFSDSLYKIDYDNELWTNHSVIKAGSDMILPINTFSKVMSFEFYFKFSSIPSSDDEIFIIKDNSNFNCGILFTENFLTFKVSNLSQNLTITSSTISDFTKWYHIKFLFDFDSSNYKFFLDGIEQTNSTGSFTNYSVSNDDYTISLKQQYYFTDLLIRQSFDTSIVHFQKNMPWSSSKILIGKDCSFHLDSFGNFWAKRMWYNV